MNLFLLPAAILILASQAVSQFTDQTCPSDEGYCIIAPDTEYKQYWVIKDGETTLRTCPGDLWFNVDWFVCACV